MLQVEDDRERRLQLETYLDRGRGECHLRQPDIAGLVEQVLRFHHANHLHFVMKIGETPLTKIVKELKRYAAREANQVLRRKGAFWCEDYFDTYIRDAEHELRTRRYLENNPVKAGLVCEPKEWPWSSARFRDEYGVLRL